jgi:hypothetical protein
VQVACDWLVSLNSAVYFQADAVPGRYCGSQSISSQILPGYQRVGVYYDLKVKMSNISVECFATTAKGLLVAFLRKYCNACAKWYEGFWSGERGRICQAHSQYAVCNNNIGMEVSWLLIKALCSIVSSCSSASCVTSSR